MELDKTEQRLLLIELLLDNSSLTIEDLSKRCATSTRSIYRSIEALKGAGFHITNNKTVYCIEADSPFIQRITNKVRFTSSELSIISKLLERADQNNTQIRNLKLKLRNVYGMQFIEEIQVNRQEIKNTQALFHAITNRRTVILHGYYSPHSKSMSDRVVEPYKFLLNNIEIRCYELSSKTNKNFKISRITGEVEVLDRKWENKTKHVDVYTDIFGFSSEKQHRITLRMGYLSTRILMEDFGVDESEIYKENDKYNLISLKVCSFQGITRFVLGLSNDIEVLGNAEFKAHLNEILQNLTKRGF